MKTNEPDTMSVVIHGTRYEIIEWDMKDYGDEYVRWELFASTPDEDGDDEDDE